MSAEIVSQVEFYFSNENLISDKFMNQSIEKCGGLPLETLMSFKRMSKFKTEEVESAINQDSKELILEEGIIKRKSPVPDLEERKKIREELNKRSAVLQNVPKNWNLDFLQTNLHDFKVISIRIKKNGLVFLSFTSVEDLDVFMGKEIKIEDTVLEKERLPEWFAKSKPLNSERGSKGKGRGGFSRRGGKGGRGGRSDRSDDKKPSKTESEGAPEPKVSRNANKLPLNNSRNFGTAEN